MNGSLSFLIFISLTSQNPHNDCSEIIKYIHTYIYMYISYTYIKKKSSSERKKLPKSHLLVTDGLGFESSCLFTKGRAEKDQSPVRGGEHSCVKSSPGGFPICLWHCLYPLAMEHTWGSQISRWYLPQLLALQTASSQMTNSRFVHNYKTGFCVQAWEPLHN